MKKMNGFKRMKALFSKKKNQIKLTTSALYASVALMVLKASSLSVFATPTAPVIPADTPDFIKNILKLLDAVQGWLYLIISVLALVLILWQIVLGMMAPDDAEKTKHSKNIKRILIMAVVAVIINAVMDVVLGYFR